MITLQIFRQELNICKTPFKKLPKLFFPEFPGLSRGSKTVKTAKRTYIVKSLAGYTQFKQRVCIKSKQIIMKFIVRL